MAPRKGKSAPVGEEASNGAFTMDKIAGLLALIATRDMGTDEAALKLDAIGFSAHEISALLGVGSNYVHVARHRKKGNAKQKKA